MQLQREWGRRATNGKIPRWMLCIFTCRPLSLTSNSVKAKLGGKYRRMYWAAESKKNSSISSTLAAVSEKIKFMWCTSDPSAAQTGITAYSCPGPSWHPPSSSASADALLPCSTLRRPAHRETAPPSGRSSALAPHTFASWGWEKTPWRSILGGFHPYNCTLKVTVHSKSSLTHLICYVAQ